jgi:hypothetical protein
VKLFKKPKSKYYWYDFTVRGHRYRASTNETKAARAAMIAGLKLAHAVQNTDPLPTKAPVLLEFSHRFLEMAQQRQKGRQDKNLLPRWLAAFEGDAHRGHAIGSDYQ